jgi:hypothetical protein
MSVETGCPPSASTCARIAGIGGARSAPIATPSELELLAGLLGELLVAGIRGEMREALDLRHAANTAFGEPLRAGC